MSSEASDLCPENKTFLEEAIVYFRNTVSREMLHFLLTDHEAWERFVAEATLSGEEAEALREGLKELQSAMDLEAGDQQVMERLLNVFPKLKLNLEEHIRMLRKLADEVDRVDDIHTVSNIVAGPMGTASGVLSILSLGLVPISPVSARSGVALSAAGAGLGAAVAVAPVSTSLVEGSSESSAIDEANRLISSDTDEEEVVAKVLRHSRAQMSSLPDHCDLMLHDAAENVRAIRLATETRQQGADLSNTMATTMSTVDAAVGLWGFVRLLGRVITKTVSS